MGDTTAYADGETERVAFRGLANPLRRSTVRYFENDATTETATREDVVAYIERDETVDATDAALRLHHIHLPQLDELGWIKYDHRSGEIQYLGHEDAAETLRQALSLVED